MNEPIEALFTSVARYEILIQGILDQGWSDRLGGMEINPLEDEKGNTTTSLCGELPDQSALTGVLNALYDMRLPLLSFKYLGEGF